MRRETVRALIPAAAAVLALAGCTPSGGGTDTGTGADTGAGTGKNGDDAPAATAAKGVALGGQGSACALPVTFELAAGWKPAAVAVEAGSELAALGEQGPVTLVCEADAKPAGNIGYLRVWRGEPLAGEPRAVLESFVAADPNTSRAAYSEVRAGTLTAVEVRYTVSGELPDEPKPERAFAVATPDGPVVVHLGGLDAQEHEEMLPAYTRARSTLALS
ncbi:lipoprotein [Streptomyces sp. NPDC006296]|uniref:lipoprotein n=1 Tax=Streptomyces sp. NPDC006296 TaxID=3156746 RepID=UPI0033B7CB0D